MTDKPLRIIFAGTPDFAALHLKGILDEGVHQVIAVYSQPDRPAGRGKKLTPSPVKIIAEQRSIPVYQPVNFKALEDQQQLRELNADLMVVVAYGLLLPQVVLDTPRLGCINVHASLLPRWRGAAPIQRAIEAGDEESGVVIMQMDAGLDTGDMLLAAQCTISSKETGGSLHDKLAEIGVPALNQALTQVANSTIEPRQQNDDLSSYAKKISKADSVIDWQLPAVVIERKIRAFNPFPISHTLLKGERIKIWQAEVSEQSGEPGCIINADKKSIVVACGKGSLRLEKIQLPGGKALDVAAVMASKADTFVPGTRFDKPAGNGH